MEKNHQTQTIEPLSANQQLRILNRAVEQMAASVMITDVTGAIHYVNAAFTENTGYTLPEILGKNPNILKSGEQPPEFYEKMWHDLTAGKVWRGELHNRRKDGSLFWELATIAPVTDHQGVITHYVAVKEEISVRKQAEQKLAEIQLREAG